MPVCVANCLIAVFLLVVCDQYKEGNISVLARPLFRNIHESDPLHISHCGTYGEMLLAI